MNKSFVAGLCVLLPLQSFAGSVETAIATALRPSVDQTIISVQKSAGGLYEVVTATDIFYTDESAKVIFRGHAYDAATKKDFTEMRLSEINKVDFGKLPLNDAVKVVKGNGKRVVVAFEDPNCPYCKRLSQSLEDMNNVTVYTFMFNILTEDSKGKSKDIWCSGNRARAWDEWMLSGKPAPTASASCITPNDENLALGQRLRITSVPTLVFADGSRIVGAVNAITLEKKLSSLTNN